MTDEEDTEDVGPCEVVHLGAESIRVLTDGGWDGRIPYSLVLDEDLADVEPGTRLEVFRVDRRTVERRFIE